MLKIVADTSVIINGQLIEQIESGVINNAEIIIPQAVFDELQSQASGKKEQGFVGLDKIKKLQMISKDTSVSITIQGSHPSSDDIRMAHRGRIDSLIVDVAKQNRAILYTSDNLQNLLAQAENLETVFLKYKVNPESLEFLKFFDSDTMSIHLKENQFPHAKKGKPGSFVLTPLDGYTY